jgi:uncharacterized membrane protein YjfL (UPF0719 family)
MNSSIALIAFIQIASSLSTGIVILWITYRGFQRFGDKYFGMRAENNMAYSILMATVLFSIGYSVSSVIQPLVSAFRLMNESSNSAFELAGTFFVQGGLYIAITYIVSILITFIGLAIYTYLTPLNEFEEIQKNNIGVAIVLSVIVITLNMMSRSGVALLIESIIPYPTLPPAF